MMDADFEFKLKHKDLAYLNLPWATVKRILNSTESPFNVMTDNPLIDLLNIIRDPNNFYFTCKHILNKEIPPFQNLILREMWNCPFPMLIASRGYSKSFTLALYSILRCFIYQGYKIAITGTVFRQAKVIFNYMEEIWNNAPVLRDMMAGAHRIGVSKTQDLWTLFVGESQAFALPTGDGCVSPDTLITYNDCFGTISQYNTSFITEIDRKVWGFGKFNNINESYYNGRKPTKIVKTRKGYKFNGTYNHNMKVFRNGEIEWARVDKMEEGDYILIDRSFRWHNGNENVTTDQAYSLGQMIGDGSWVKSGLLRYTTIDNELIDYLVKGTDLEWKQCSDKVHWNHYGKEDQKKWLDFWEMKVSYTKDKELPPKLMRCSREVVSACLSGIFDTDGTVHISKAKGGVGIQISLTNTSQKLMEQIHYILLHYGIVSHLKSRTRKSSTGNEWNLIYELIISGLNVKLFVKYINFRLSRKRKLLEEALLQQQRNVSHENIPTTKELMLEIIKEYNVKINSQKIQPSKIRKRKNIDYRVVSQFLENYGHIDDWRINHIKEISNPSIFYDVIEKIEDSVCDTYDIHVPIIHEYCANGFFSHNTRIRGLRANSLIADEFASMNPDIFETVLSGFTVVSSSPIKSMQRAAEIKIMKEVGVWTEEHENFAREKYRGNQIILSGTAYYAFNHFYKYWQKYKRTIESKGDREKLIDIYDGDVPEDIDWKSRKVFRFPIELVPDGFMDKNAIDRAKLHQTTALYNCEYGACFITDSDGFFRRALIEHCTTTSPIQKSQELVRFKAVLKGDPNKKYFFGVDPASEKDNFSIVVVEQNVDHARIVYVWTTTDKRHKQMLKAGLVQEHDFYRYTARKIRNLMKIFPCEIIAMDSQGGGKAVSEALREPINLEPGEIPILPVDCYHTLSDGKEKPTDDEPGLHMLELVNFVHAEYTSESNHGLRKDFETQEILFPFFDGLEFGMAAEEDEFEGRNIDTLETCIMEIQELKDELATIVMTQTPSGRDRWDTPEIKETGARKGYMRKDRYSALLMAAYACRRMRRNPPPQQYYPVGGFAQGMRGTAKNKQLYTAPSWFTERLSSGGSMYGCGVNRNTSED